MIGGVLQRIGPQDSLGHPSNHSRKKKIYSSVKYTIEYIYGSELLSVRFLNNSSSLLLKEIRTELESISHSGTRENFQVSRIYKNTIKKRKIKKDGH